MNYKEKYKNAIEQLRGLLDGIHEENCEITEEDLIKIFPEIKEEDYIPTWLTKYIEEEAYNLSMDIRDNEDRIKLKKLQKALAWLEKQGEQKPADNVEPKFKVGDWIACEELNTALIVNIDDDKYEVEFIDGNKGFPHIDYIDRNFHLWTIQDAKDGDVLQLGGGVTAIFQEYIGYGNCKCCCSIYNGEFEIPIEDGENNIYGCTNSTPATKEQRDVLFLKMKESGYEWYNHTLIKTEPDNYSDYFKFEGNGEDEISDGKMLLYVLNKGINQGKKEIAEKSRNFIEMLADKFTILNYETKNIYNKQQLIDDFNEFINK